MWEYLREHERLTKEFLARESTPEELGAFRQYHEKQIRFLQHERMIHLLVTMFVALFLLLCLGYSLMRPSIAAATLTVIFLALSCAYLHHYYRLENGVQRLYQLSNQLEMRQSQGVIKPLPEPRAASRQS